MKWGEVQSVIQLAVALNAIYLSLRDIRNPHVRQEHQELADASAALNAVPVTDDTKNKIDGIRVLINNTKVLLDTKIDSFDRVDRLVGISCAGCIAFYVVLLIVSAFFYKSELYLWFAWLICVLGFLPIGVGLALNLGLVQGLKSGVSKGRLEIDKQFAELTATGRIQKVTPVPGLDPKPAAGGV